MEVLRKWTEAEKLESTVHPGRPARRIAGGWVTDLAEINKCVMLCDSCAHKFDHRKYGYVTHAVLPYQPKAIGTCDGCKQHMIFCTMFLKTVPK